MEKRVTRQAKTMFGVLFLLTLLRGTESLAATNRPSILVIGGSGRVGGSAVRSLIEHDLDVTVGGRSSSNFEASIDRSPSLNKGAVKFQPLDIHSEQQLDAVIPNYDVIVHTAGPFQGLKDPGVLTCALQHGKKYVDVMDDVGLSRIARAAEYQDLAKETGATAVVSAGIWPGGSSLLAQQAIDAVGGGDKVQSICFDFFTAGSGNAGTTIITATFLILGEDVLTYEKGRRVYKKSASDSRMVNFGDIVGDREVVRLNLIECESSHVSSGVQNVQTNFGTAPPLWNSLFALMANLMPQRVLQNRDWMEKLAVFSMPMIRLIDTFVGSTNSIKVTLTLKDGKTTCGALMTHPDLEAGVGDALAAFVVQMLNNESEDSLPSGVFYPEEMPSRYREAVLSTIKKTATEVATF